MKNFAQARSPPNGANAGRDRSHAANLKLPVNASLTNQTQRQQIQRNAPQSSLHANHQAGPRPVSQQASRGARTGQKQNAWETDAESIDTTVNSRDVLPAPDNQASDHGYEEDEEEYGDPIEYEGDGRSGHGGYNLDEFNGISPEEFNRLSQGDPNFLNTMERSTGQAVSGIPGLTIERVMQTFSTNGSHLFEGDDSYPTTTSGRPDNEPEEELPQVGQGHHAVPQHYKAEEDQPQRSSSEPPEARQPNRSANMHQKAATLRHINRSENAPNMPPPAAPREQRRAQQIPIHPAIPSSQPPTYSQVTKEEPETPPQIPNGQTPGRASHRQPYGPPRHQAQEHARTQSALSTIASVETTQRTRNGFDHEGRPESPTEDYDQPALFDMPYEQLRNENFDHHPRPRPSVLNDETAQKPLAERLAWVQEHLKGTDQDRFFGALTTNEWEEAGDWFLERFGDIINRMRKARQAKRKLAVNFEKEVGERNDGVAKRQRLVEKAMDDMKMHGQGLLPRSPRRD